MVLVATHPRRQRRWIRGDDAPDFVAEFHCDGGEDVMMGAATQEKLGDRAMRVVVAAVPARCPADDLELVVVAVSDHITTGVGESADDVQVTGRGSPVH